MWWTPGFPPDIGGIERLAALVLPELARHGVEVCVVANTDDTELSDTEYLGVPVTRIPSRRAMATRDLRLLAASKRRVIERKEAFRPDLVHVHMSDPSIQLHLTTATPRTRTVVSIHNHAMGVTASDPTATLFGRAIAEADAVTAVVASALPAALREATGDDRRIVAVVPNGVVIGGEPAPLPHGPPVVLAVGRLVDAKGFDVALHAFARSAARRRGATLRVVGDGPERGALAQLATELGLDLGTDVVFTGSLAPSSVSEEYARASLVLMPSRREGQPLVAMEAAAAGRPVLGSRIPGLVDVVIDGTTGMLAAVDDADAFATSLDGLLADPEPLTALGATARRRAVEEYSLDVCVERHLALYREVLERSEHP